MANNPNILVFGLPAREEFLLRQCLGPENIEQVGIYDSLDELSQGIQITARGFRDAVSLILLDRSYDIKAKVHTPREGVFTPFGDQLAPILSLFPHAEVLCITNSPLRFSQEEGIHASFDPRFRGVVSYASVHQNTHFSEPVQK